MKDQSYKQNALMFKAFCDENRLLILDMLKDGEKCACVLLEKLNIAQSTLSHHMKILVDSSIVSARKNGKWTYYSLSLDHLQYAISFLETLKKTPIDNSSCVCK